MVQNDALFNVNWKLQPGVSIFSTEWKPDTETRVYEPVSDNGYKLTVSGIHKGQPYEWGYTALYDGKDHPVYGRDDVDAIEAYRINEKITIGFFKKGGVLGGAYARKTDSDSLTVQAGGRRVDGTPYYDVVVYKKS